jgi:hypothetical protein
MAFEARGGFRGGRGGDRGGDRGRGGRGGFGDRGRGRGLCPFSTADLFILFLSFSSSSPNSYSLAVRVLYFFNMFPGH